MEERGAVSQSRLMRTEKIPASCNLCARYDPRQWHAERGDTASAHRLTYQLAIPVQLSGYGTVTLIDAVTDFND